MPQPQPQPLPPFTKDDLRKALGAIWHKAPAELKNEIDVLCDEIQERGLAGDMAEGVPSAPPGFIPSPAGSMTPPEAEPESESSPSPPASSLSPPPSAHAATDWGSGTTDGGDESEGEIEGGWARYL